MEGLVQDLIPFTPPSKRNSVARMGETGLSLSALRVLFSLGREEIARRCVCMCVCAFVC